MKLNLCLRPMVVLACAALLAATTFTARAQVPNGWSFAAWTSDVTSGIEGTNYTHAYSFASGTATTINGIRFTGIPGSEGTSPSVAGSFTTANYFHVLNGDGNNINSGGSAQLARDFVYGDGVNNQS